MAENVTIFKTGNNNDEVEIPLLYNIEYTYKGDDAAEVMAGITQEINEKIGEDAAPGYIESIFNDATNNTRFSDSTHPSYYDLDDSSILNPTNEIVQFSKRPLKVMHWEGVFPFIEYFTYNMPDKLFKVILDEEQNILITEYEFTYKPVFMYFE
jgi:hypothetical protein